LVIKKDGSREMFSRQKILSGMLRACEKRPIQLETLEKASLEVERALREGGKGEVTTKETGELVMERLRAIDEVAYVRFASVYREFADLSGFREELERILEDKKAQGRSEREQD
jgi:transcriptional repressor NrdR